MGLIINRPSSVTLANGLNGHFELPEDGELIFTGGPVEPSALFMIHNSADLDPTENPVLPGLYMGGSAEVFEAVVQSKLEGEPGLKFRVFSGCAGWAGRARRRHRRRRRPGAGSRTSLWPGSAMAGMPASLISARVPPAASRSIRPGRTLAALCS